MDALNAHFQDLLAQRQFPLKTTVTPEGIQYQGRLGLDESKTVDFKIHIPRSETREVVQIVFEHLATCIDVSQRQNWLAYLNDVNTQHGVSYYFCLREDNEVFARYILPVDPDRTEVILELLQIGGHLVRTLRLDQFQIEEDSNHLP